MLKVTKLREVTRNDLFPSADMVISMSREFGVPLTAEDFGGELYISNQAVTTICRPHPAPYRSLPHPEPPVLAAFDNQQRRLKQFLAF